MDAAGIPKSLEECFTFLDEEWSAADLEAFQATHEANLSALYGDRAKELLEKWDLGQGSPLGKDLWRRGCLHPTAMASYVLHQFWRHLHGHAPQEYGESVQDRMNAMEERVAVLAEQADGDEA